MPDPLRFHRADAASTNELLANTTFLDGNPSGCRCTKDCEFPCWQRVGLTSHPCCRQCDPLPEVDE